MIAENKYIISSNLVDIRLDKALVILDDSHSRTYYLTLIKNGFVTVNGEISAASYKVCEGDEILVQHELIDKQDDIKPTEISLNIIYEDEDILIIDKPQGLVVHPGAGHHEDTLLNGLIFSQKELSSVNGIERLGIVHRIDKDTSGLLLVCKTDEAHNFIANQLKDHTMHREYIALVVGNFQNERGKIIAPISRCKTNRLKMEVNPVSGKEAVTHFKVLKRFEKYSLVECILETGRTHQIRVHMEYINHPIVGDPLYGKNNCALYNNGQLLHAYKLTFIHPRTKKEVSFTSPLPTYFEEIINKLK